MGWLQNIKSALSGKRAALYYAGMMNGSTPIYSAFGRDIYASDVVTQATRCITDEVKKLAPTHVRRVGADIVPVTGSDSLQRVLNNPNHYMTTADFLGKIMYTYFSKANSWIIPTYREDNLGRRTYTGLYPVNPDTVTFMEDETGTLFVELKFAADSQPWVLPYSDIIHLRRDYGADEYMGGGLGGLPDDRGLLETLELNHQMLQGVSRAMKASQVVNGVVKYGSVLGQAQSKEAMAEFEAKLANNKNGFIVLDMAGEFIPITRDIKLVDDRTLKFIDEKILRNFGVSLPILTGDYDKAQYEAFYQKTIEPLRIQLSQEFTRVLFTPTERGHSNEIKFYSKELVFMSMDQIISTINLLAPTGTLYENEKRVAFGWAPDAALAGKRYMSLNWIDANQANKYQVGQDDNEEHNGGAENE